MREPRNSSKLKGELHRKEETMPEENSKIQLQQLLESRKILLRKEKAMAYARGLVAGFSMETMDHLISFAEAFGATRLREACANYIELCKKKLADQLWMAELAAVKACSLAELSLLGPSGIVLTNEFLEAPKSHPITPPATLDSTKVNNLSASDHQTPSTAPKYQMPMPWVNQMPQYIYNFPGLVQQLPSYQGYSFPPMQHVPLHYPRNTHQPPNRSRKSSSGKKEKSPNGKEDEYSGEDGQTESSASDSGSDSGSHTLRWDKNQSQDRSSRGKHRNKSSRTIVIHNINYITPRRKDGEKCQVSDGSSLDEDDITGKKFFREKIEGAVGSLEECCKLNSSDDKSWGTDRGHCTANGSEDASQRTLSDDLETCVSKGGKIDNNWESLQNILMTNANASVKGVETYASTPAVDLESEEVLKQQMVSADSFLVKERDERSENIVKLDDFVNEESFCPLMKSSNCTDEILFNRRSLEESTNELGDILSARVEESSIIKSGKGEDWFVVNYSGKQENHDSTSGQLIFDGNQVLPFKSDNPCPQKSKGDIIIDDSFMVQARPELEGECDLQWKIAISMIADSNLEIRLSGLKI